MLAYDGIAHPPLILLVDDDVSMLDILKRLLEEQQYRVLTAANGKEAISMVTQHLPSLVLMDASMPVMDGFQACRFLQEHPDTKDIPVVMLTALHDSHSVDEAYDAGAFEYITKPINWAVLRHRINTLLNALHAQAALAQSEARFRNIYEHSAMGILLTDPQGRILAANPAVQKTLGLSDDILCQQFFSELFFPTESPVEREFLQQLRSHKRDAYQVDKYFLRHRQRCWVRLTISLTRTTDKKEEIEPSFVCMVEDITAQNRARARQRIASRVFESINDGIVVMDNEGYIIDVNQAFSLRTGYRHEELLQQVLGIFSPKEAFAEYEKIWQQLLKTGSWKGTIQTRYKDGSLHEQTAAFNAVKDEYDEISAYVVIYSDQVPTSQNESLTHHQTSPADPLTGLPHREALRQQLKHLYCQGDSMALLCINLSQLPHINDHFGHKFGHHLLHHAAKHLLQCAQQHSFTARLDDNELALIVSPLEQASGARGMADKIASLLSQPVYLDPHDIQSPCHVGISYQAGHLAVDKNDQQGAEERVDALIQHARLAMHLAKDNNKSTYQVFADAEMEAV